MTETEFWSLIEASKLESQGNLDLQVERLQRTLERQSEPEIIDFDQLLHEQMAKSYSRDLWAAAYIINGGCSDDGFDYFRAWLIAQGRDSFENALHDPESLAGIAEAGVELEPLLYVAAKAYEKKNGTKFPHPTYPQAELSGDGWSEDEEYLRERYPRLFERFWDPDSAPKMRVKKVMNISEAMTSLRNKVAGGEVPALNAEQLYMQAVFLAMDETEENLAKSANLLTQAADQDHA